MSSPAPRLDAVYHRRHPGDGDRAAWTWFGTFDVTLTGLGADVFPPGSQLALWCTTGLEPGPGTNAQVVERNGGRLVVTPHDHAPLARSRTWEVRGLRATFPARHANDGPEAAYIVRPDGTTVTIEVRPATTSHRPVARTPRTDHGTGSTNDDELPAIVPMPQHVDTRGDARPRRLVITEPSASAAAVVALARRLGVDVFDGDRDGEPVRIEARLDGATPAGAGSYAVTIADDRATLVAADDDGCRHGLITLAQLAATGLPDVAEIDDVPAMTFRGVHLDLARRWYEPAIVERLIDLAAWRKLDRVHLHLTDDEAWRFPVPEYPALAAIGGARGHGLPVPPLCASGPEPYGRAYTAGEIATWVQRADELGIVLVPEVDVPAHCLAALTAVPGLRDPDDTSNAHSVQGYLDNVLVPGHAETAPFLTAVFAALAALFPSSPVLHIGGDEVPHGAWRGSPIAQAYAAEHGLTTSTEIEARFHRELIDIIRTTTGRDVAMWEEAALGGAGRGAYAIAWTSAASAARLAALGHQVVVAPGEAYYLDMAFDRAWESPGSTWAGTVPLEATVAFDPRLDDASDALLGVQACIWGEHIVSLEVLDELTFPRLDAVAERGWRGEIAGGARSLARRTGTLPRFSPPPHRR